MSTDGQHNEATEVDGLTISHTRPAGTLIEGTSRGDGTAEVLKSCGWRWSRNLGAWYVPQSRDSLAKRHLIDTTQARLQAAGHQVTVTVDDTARPAAEVEADRIERQIGRVDALNAKAGRQQGAADVLDSRAGQLADMLPLGQPILVGHHSEGKMRRHAEKVDRTMRAAVDAQREADLAAGRADAASTTTRARYSPVTVANRIDKLGADIRDAQRRSDGHTRNVGGYIETTPPAEGDYRDRLIDRIADLTDQLTFWQQIREQLVIDGQATNYGPEIISKGDRVKIRGTWYRVVRANKKTVTVPSSLGTWTNTSPYQEIQEHQPTPAPE